MRSVALPLKAAAVSSSSLLPAKLRLRRAPRACAAPPLGDAEFELRRALQRTVVAAVC